MDDCKTANNVNYCYCSKSLCNSNILKHATPANYDDEDDGELEGSGSNTETASEKAITPKLNKTTTQIIETNAVDSSDFLRPTVYTLFIALYVYIIISWDCLSCRTVLLQVLFWKTMPVLFYLLFLFCLKCFFLCTNFIFTIIDSSMLHMYVPKPHHFLNTCIILHLLTF